MNEAINILHVGKVVLSEECISELESMQSNNNDMLNDTIRALLTSIMLLNLPEGESERIKEKKKENIENLSIIVMNLERLGIPT